MEHSYTCDVCERDFTDEVDDRSSFDEIGKIICKDCFEEEEEYTPFDEYEEDGVRIMSFYTDETHFAETQIFRYYDNKKWWLKHKTDEYFLLIEQEE